MTKIETLTFEYEHCGECPCLLIYFTPGHNGCDRMDPTRKIANLWGDIADWCPLEEKKDAKV